jgi:uncharacterized protein YdaT
MLDTLPTLPPPRNKKGVQNAFGQKDDRLERAADGWNKLAARYGLGRIIKITTSRAKHVFARFDEPEFDLVKIADAFAESDFLQGKNARGWKPTFDWLFGSTTNYIKILEGRYSNAGTGRKHFENGREIFDGDSIRRAAEIARNASGAARVA